MTIEVIQGIKGLLLFAGCAFLVIFLLTFGGSISDKAKQRRDKRNGKK